jgi:prophage regulatory protein
MSDKPYRSVQDTGRPAPPLLRLPAVLQLTGLARSTVYRMVADHTFPAPVRIAKRAVAWRREELQRWTEQRPPASLT